MGLPPTSREVLQEALDLKAKYGGWAEASRVSRVPINTLKSRGDRAKAAGLMPLAARIIDDTNMTALVESLRSELGVAREALSKAQRPKFSIRQDASSQSSKMRVVCIGDAHDSPEIPDKSRFEWIGKYINSVKPDVVVQIGDFATMDSLNTHTPNDTFAGKSKPTFMKDMESFNLALDAMQIHDGIERHCTLGNHERRLWLFEDRAPEAYGMMQFELLRIFERHKWGVSPYGEMHFYGGVGFTHIPLNKLGKAYGGKTAASRIASDSLHSVVHGHDHLEGFYIAPKIGHNRAIEVLDLGCALPDQHVEPYCFHAATGWSYGVEDIEIVNGRITDRNRISMRRLQEMYA